MLDYLDASNVLHGTVTVYWDTQTTAPFSLNGTFPTGTLQTPYSGTITSNSPSPLASAAVYRGHLPAGLALGVSGTSVTLTGNPSEAGYFDLWIQATNTEGQSSYIYQRLAVKYITPLTILTASLPAIVDTVAYSQTLQGYGGVPPYTWDWDVPTSFPAINGIIVLNSSTGAITGTYSGASPLGPFPVTFTLTDSNSNVTTRVISMTVNNALVITTTAVAPMTLSQPYSFTMQAAGGIPPYTWAVTAGTLPTGSPGITLSASGVLSGTPTQVGYGTQSITFQVTDSTYVTTANATLPVTVGVVSGMVINTSGVGEIYRGENYLGTLAVNGSYTTPVSWSVTSDSPNPLPSGLSLTASVSDNGATAKIAGLYTGTAFPGYICQGAGGGHCGPPCHGRPQPHCWQRPRRILHLSPTAGAYQHRLQPAAYRHGRRLAHGRCPNLLLVADRLAGRVQPQQRRAVDRFLRYSGQHDLLRHGSGRHESLGYG